jgi:uncharacterized protein
VKLVVSEEDSRVAAELWDRGQRRISNLLSYPEGRAALAAARRADRLTEAGYRRALTDFETTQSELDLIGVDRDLAHWAGQLAADHGLRGYDSVHLASALALGRGVTLVSWDKSLSRAAQRTGCDVAPAL